MLFFKSLFLIFLSLCSSCSNHEIKTKTQSIILEPPSTEPKISFYSVLLCRSHQNYLWKTTISLIWVFIITINWKRIDTTISDTSTMYNPSETLIFKKENYANSKLPITLEWKLQKIFKKGIGKILPAK